MRPVLPSLCLALLLSLPPQAGAATIVIDPFTDPLPANACLPASGAQVVFCGAFCDGAACPPASLVDACPGSGFTEQPGLLYGGAGNRIVAMNPMRDPPSYTSAWIEPAAARLHVDGAAGGSETNVDIAYDRYGAAVDLAAAGMNQFAFTVGGGASAQSPLPFYIVIQSSASNLFATVTGQATASGAVVIPFSAFEVDPGFDFSQVDWVSLSFGHCDRTGCSSGAPIPSFTLEQLRFQYEPTTPVRRNTWGALKSAYR